MDEGLAGWKLDLCMKVLDKASAKITFFLLLFHHEYTLYP
jgi:hypothetical protein